MLKIDLLVLITFLKIQETKFVFFNSIFDYIFKSQKPKKLLKIYTKLLTIDVNLRLTENQHIAKRY
jgi:hypothetical protein